MWLGRLWDALLKAAPVRLWAIILAGPVLCQFAAVLVWIIWRGNWPANLAGKRLDYLGWALITIIVQVTIIIVALALVRVRAIGPAGTSIEISSRQDEHGP